MRLLFFTLLTIISHAAFGQGDHSIDILEQLKKKVSNTRVSSINQIVYNDLKVMESKGVGFDLEFVQSVDSLLVIKQDFYLDNLALIGRKLSVDGNKREAYSFLNRVVLGLDKGLKLNDDCAFYEAIGDCYFFFKNFDQAKTFLLKAINCPNINELSKINVYNTLGLIHVRSDETMAEDYYLRAIEIAVKLDHQIWYGVITGNIGALYLKRGKLDLALQFFETDTKLSLENKLYDSAISAISEIIEIHIKREDVKQAKLWMSRMDSIAATVSERIKGIAYYEASSMYNAYIGNYEIAYKHSLRAKHHIDSINQIRSEIHNKNMEFQIAYERQLAQFNILEEKAKSYEKTKYSLILLILSITTGSVFSIVQIIKRRKKEKELFELKSKKANENIERMEAELKSLLKSLIDKNDTINKLNNDIQELFSHVEGSEDDRISLTDKLQSFTLLTDEDWVQFKHLFEKRFPGFFTYFQNNYSGITNAELRLAALLKLNLENLEISKALGIGADSVRKTNLRLRKRLQLEDQKELLRLIHSINN